MSQKSFDIYRKKNKNKGKLTINNFVALFFATFFFSEFFSCKNENSSLCAMNYFDIGCQMVKNICNE